MFIDRSNVSKTDSNRAKQRKPLVFSRHPLAMPDAYSFQKEKLPTKRIRQLLFVFFALILWPTSSATIFPIERALVLVAGVYSDIKPLAPDELRRLFLGMPIYKESRKLVPLINLTDRFVHEVFLQKIVFMSAEIYAKQLTLRRAIDRHLSLNINQLQKQLINNDSSVSYMWRKAARIDPRLKVIQTLWTVQK